MNKYIQSDQYRLGGGKPPMFQIVMRKCVASRGVIQIFYRLIYKYLRTRRGIEIDWDTEIGYGLYIGHPYGITINRMARIGNNCNIHKGATIGQENRGKRKGYPTIGNNVYIGINATVCGNVTIGDDVMIASNSFVNFDVPNHSIVFGNPGIIKHKEKATENYIINEWPV